MSSTETSGIYCIRHVDTARVYVGSAMRIQERWDAHRRRLTRGNHHSVYLQRAWTKYGEELFEFIVLEYVEDASVLISREQVWMDDLAAFGRNGFNMCPTAGSPLGRKVTPETLEKLRVANTGRRHSEETKAKISKGNRGKTRTEEVKEKIRTALTGRPGTTRTPEQRIVQSLRQKGIPHRDYGAKGKSETCANGLPASHISRLSVPRLPQSGVIDQWRRDE